MKWSYKVCRLFGIDVYLRVTFLAVLAFVGWFHWALDGTFASAALNYLQLAPEVNPDERGRLFATLTQLAPVAE